MQRNDWPHVIELRHIRLVAALAAHGTVTAAARALSLSQSALSHQLRELELRLRTPLYVRTQQRMIPTPAGEQLGAVVSRVAKDLREFELQVRSGRYSDASGQIRLVAESHTTYHWLPLVLQSFRESWPGIDVQVRPELAHSVFNALRDGVVDIGVVQTGSSDRRILTRFLFDDSYVLVTSPQHPLQARPFITLDALGEEQLLINGTGPGGPIEDDVLKPAGVVPEQVTYMPLTETILEMVAADMGVSILSKWAVRPWLAAGRVRAVRLTEFGVARRWYVATRQDDPSTTVHERLIELLGLSLPGHDLQDLPRRAQA